MNIKQTIKLAWKSLTARMGRTFLSMLGIIIGIAAVITLVSYSKGQMQAIMAVYESMGNNKFSVYAYRWDVQEGDDTLFNSISNFCKRDLADLVEGISLQIGFWGRVKYNTKDSYNFSYSDYDSRPPEVYLGSEQWSAVNNVTIAKGRDISYLDVKNAHQVCVLGARAARAFFDYSDPIGATMTFDGVPFTVIGVYEFRIDETVLDENTEWYKTMDNFIILPYTTARAIRASGSYSVDSWSNEFFIQCVDAKAMNEAKSRLDNYMKTLVGDPKDGTSYGNYSINDNSQYVEEQMDTGKQQGALLATIAAISLIVSGIGIMNIMLVTVTERTREIGIRKAIGAERKTIIIQFLIEACMICGIGGLLGIAASYPATWVYCKVQLGYLVQPDTQIMGVAAGLSVILGIIFGLYPAIKASGLQPVEALRAD